MMKPAHARMARAALRWSLLDVQKRTGINKNTIVRFESGKGILLTTATRLEELFVRAGISFIYEDEARGPGVIISKELSHRNGDVPEMGTKYKPTKRRAASK